MPLKDRQLKRLGRIEERNPNRAEYVAKNMLKRENRQSERADKKAEKAQLKSSRAVRGSYIVKDARERYGIPMSSRDERAMYQERQKKSAMDNKGRDFPLSPTPEPNKNDDE